MALTVRMLSTELTSAIVPFTRAGVLAPSIIPIISPTRNVLTEATLRSVVEA